MDRREFLITTSGAAVAASAAATASAAESELASPSIVGSRRTLELANTWPDDGKGFGDSARRLARSAEIRVPRGVGPVRLGQRDAAGAVALGR